VKATEAFTEDACYMPLFGHLLLFVVVPFTVLISSLYCYCCRIIAVIR